MLGVGRRELRRYLCICVKEFNMERSAQFRDGERVDSSTGTAERLDAVKRGLSRIDVGPLKRLNSPRADGLQTVVVQRGVETVRITLGNYHVEPAQLWLVLIVGIRRSM